MGREDHGYLLDSKDQWWVECPNSHDRIPLTQKPDYCPHCGEFIAPKDDTSDELKEIEKKMDALIAKRDELFNTNKIR